MDGSGRHVWTAVEVRRLSVQHLYSHDAQRPDVYFCPILLPGNYFRGHPVGSSHKRLLSRLLAIHSGTKPKSDSLI